MADWPRTAAKPEVIACINDAWETKPAFSSPHHLYPVVLYGWSLANESWPPLPLLPLPHAAGSLIYETVCAVWMIFFMPRKLCVRMK